MPRMIAEDAGGFSPQEKSLENDSSLFARELSFGEKPIFLSLPIYPTLCRQHVFRKYDVLAERKGDVQGGGAEKPGSPI